MMRRMNRLGTELSPYLRQHAENPVDWFPWGEDAFARARAEGKPILLSIGYSACHWCHVMEHESFSDAAIAKVMNERFVSVKVDREERPDVDHVYQLVVQMMGRTGGWPLTVFLTPTLEPFFGGTYYPSTPKYGMPSFPQILDAVHDAWTNRRAEVTSSAKDLAGEIVRVTSPATRAGDIPKDVARGCAMLLSRRYDEAHGGFGAQPKFPNTMAHELLLRAAHDGDREAFRMADKALVAMRAGGIWDQLGGGYHRYSTDAQWLVPHFEKMLYDNALLLRAHGEAFRASRDLGTGARSLHAETARGITGYLARAMRSTEGLFFATEDADSEGEEGRFFVWTRAQLDEVLGAELGALAARRFGVEEKGNFEGGAASVLSLATSLDVLAKETGRSEAELARMLDDARTRLFEARARRPHPFRDEKILATWNGLVIGALATAGTAIGEPAMVAMARNALDAVRTHLWDGTTLHRLRKDGATKPSPGFLEDYADVASAAIDVAEATDDAEALRFAATVFDAACDAFWDEAAGTFYFTRAGATDLIARTSDAYDHAVPSALATMAHVALRLSVHLGRPDLEARAERVLRAHVTTALKSPLGLAHALGAMDRLMRGATEVIVVGAHGAADTEALLAEARAAWQPSIVIARVDPDAPSTASDARLGGKRQVEGRATAYVCRERACGLPITEPRALRAELTPAHARAEGRPS
jgi:uncharacterized protein YyaL (SSP411 family)